MSRFEDPVIITCSISGAVANRDQCPAIPYTPEEYAAEARRIVDEGGAMIHIHARTPEGVPSYESWWDVPVAEVSTSAKVRAARSGYERDLTRERSFL